MIDIMFDIPEFTSPLEAKEVLDELANNSEEIQYTDKRGWRVTRARNRINNFWKHFLSRAGRMQADHLKASNEYKAWSKLIKKATKCQAGLIAMKEKLSELEGIY